MYPLRGKRKWYPSKNGKMKKRESIFFEIFAKSLPIHQKKGQDYIKITLPERARKTGP